MHSRTLLSSRSRGYVQGKCTSFGCHRTELEACTAAIQAFKQHGPPELQAYLCQEPQPITPQPPVAAPISLDPCSPDTASAEDRPLLRRFLQATRDPRMMSHVQTGAPAFDTEHHKQQQRLSAVQQPDIPAQKAVGEQCSIAKPSFKPTPDGRYRLPPRLRKTAGSGWIRGYRARKVQAAQPFFVYEVDISFTVRIFRPAALYDGATCQLAWPVLADLLACWHRPCQAWSHLCTRWTLHDAATGIMSSMSRCQRGP